MLFLNLICIKLYISLKKKNLDFVVVGTGFASYAAVSMLLSKNIKPLVIDCGKYSQFLKPEDEFKIPHGGKSNEFSSYLNIENSEDVEILLSNNFGGLSNVWGGCINKYHINEYKKSIFSYKIMDRYYCFIDKLFGQYGANDTYSSAFNLKYIRDNQNSPLEKLKNHKILNSKLKKNILAGSSRILVNNTNNKIVNLKVYFKKLIEKKKIKFLNLFEVVKIIESKNNVKLISHSNKTLVCDKVFLATGAIQTAKIILNSQSKIKSVKFYETKLIASLWGSFFSLFHKIKKNSYCGMYLTKIKKPFFHTQFYFVNENLLNKIFNKIGFKERLIKKIFILLQNYLFFTLSYIDQSYSNTLILKKIKNKYLFKYHDAKLKFINHINYSIRNLFINKIIKIFSLNKKKFGYGYHYGSSFPYSAKKKLMTSDLYGRVGNFRNTHIIDSSVLFRIPISTITYSVMANAARIVEFTLKKTNK